MVAGRDSWYIRLPNGQELKAKSTNAVVHHVAAGLIPKTSLVRRSHGDEWTMLEWTVEFADLLAGKAHAETAGNGKQHAAPVPPRTGVASRLDPLRLQTVGVRGLWEDLLAALDHAMSGGKPVFAALAGAAVGLILIVVPWVVANVLVAVGLTDAASNPLLWPTRLVMAGAAVIAVCVVAAANAVLARMTHTELSEMRPVRAGEAMRGSWGTVVRLALGLVLVVGAALVLMRGVRWVPAAAASRAASAGLVDELAGPLVVGLSVAGLVVEVALWCAIALAALLGPILVVEDCSLGRGIVAWFRLIRENLGKLLLAEALAVGLGALASMPFALPVWLAGSHYPGLPPGALNLAYGIALAPLTAFLAVANVFIYLNVRYEQEK